MKGNLWTLVVVAVGAGLMLRGADTAVPDSPASSTDSVVSVLTQVAPFAGQLLALCAIGALILLALRIE